VDELHEKLTRYFTLDDGTKIKINNLLDFAEEVYNKL